MDPPAPFHPTATRRVRATVRVGVGVLVLTGENKNKVWAGMRKGSHGASTLALPGGHLEVNETWSDCAAREVEEEMGLSLTNVRFFHATNDIMLAEEKHYVTIFMVASQSNPNEIPSNREPNKCEGWDAYTVDQLVERRDQLFLPLANLLQEKKTDLEALLLARRRTINRCG